MSYEIQVFHVSNRSDVETDDERERVMQLRHDVPNGMERADDISALDLYDYYERAGVDTIEAESKAKAAKYAYSRWETNPHENAPNYTPQEQRSVMVGDVIFVDGYAFMVASIGFERKPQLDKQE